MKFDAVVGNPPYQEESIGENNSDNSIYHYFYDLAEKISPQYCLISPARFLSNAGKTPKNWNQKMLNDEHLKVVHFENKSRNLFPSTDIKGGIVILYRNEKETFGAIKVFTSSKELTSIAKKIEDLIENTLDAIVSNRGQYRYSDLIYNEHPQEMLRTSDRRIASSAFERFPEFFTTEKPQNNFEYIQIYGRNNNKRQYKWFRRDYLSAPTSFEKYKVIIPKANGSGAIGETISSPLIGNPFIGFTETFISIGEFDNKLEAKNALKYIKTKFARAMLSVLKTTQNNSKETWAKVPLQDFTPKSDIDWSKSITEIDQQLYKKYGLDQDEIDFIEKEILPMD